MNNINIQNKSGNFSHRIHPIPPNTAENKTKTIGLKGSTMELPPKSRSKPSIPTISKRLPKRTDIIINAIPAKKQT
jgi:hypothetical protein